MTDRTYLNGRHEPRVFELAPDGRALVPTDNLDSFMLEIGYFEESEFE